MKTLFAGLAFASIVAAGLSSASAADIQPMQAHIARFTPDTSVLVFFTAEHDGFHVVSTTQDGKADAARVARFVTVLAPGQKSTVSFPAGPDHKPATLLFSRNGSRLHIDEAVEIASAK